MERKEEELGDYRNHWKTWNMQMMYEYAWYLINMSICKGNWMTSGRNLRRLSLKLIPQRQKKYVLIQ
jgi:hypothetical protein